MKNDEYIRIKDISEIKGTLNNRVLVRTAYRNEEVMSEGGIILIAGTETDWRPAEHTNRISEVVVIPERLNFSNRPTDYDSMPWDTDIQIQVGDLVWHDFMAVHNCVNVVADNQPDEEYKLLNYQDLYVVKRGEEIIPLNGYCLCEEVLEKRLSDMQVTDPKVDNRFGKVVYLAEPNREYRQSKTTDEAEVAVGDVIIKRKAAIHILLESKDHARFDGDKMYFIIQRRDVYGVVEEKPFAQKAKS